MFKKVLSTVLVMAMMVSMGTSVMAEENIQSGQITVTEDTLISFFDPYIEPNNEGLLSLNLPSTINLDIEPELYQQVLDALENTNDKIIDGDLNLMLDGTLIDPNAIPTNNISSYGSGQVNMTTPKWWGWEVWMSYNNAINWVFEYDQARLVYAATVVAGAGGMVFIPVFGAPGAVAFSITSSIPLVTMELVSNKAHHLLATNSGRGIVVNQWDIIIGTTVNPQ